MKEFWEQRYAEAGFAYGTEPNAWLASLAGLFRPGQTALVIGDGEGRNGVWLAEQGLEVTSVDMAASGLAKARALARERGVSLETVCADLTAWDWPEAQFDYVVLIYVHFPPEVRAQLHRKAYRALKPGGQIILEAFTFEQLGNPSGGPPRREMLYDAALLKSDFPAEAEWLQLEECQVELDEGRYHVGPAAIVRARLRRPSG